MRDNKVTINHLTRIVRVISPSGAVMSIPFEFIELNGITADMTKDIDVVTLNLLDVPFSEIEVVR